MLNITDLQLRLGPKAGDPLLYREPEIMPDGVLHIGATSGPPWRYLPEGYGQAAASAVALQQLADDLASLRAIAATDEDLAAEVAAIEELISEAASSGATDTELAAAITPIATAIDLLASEDQATATLIAAIQSSVGNLDATYATDQQLATAIAQIQAQNPVRSVSAPAAPAIGQRWIELSPSGAEIYDFAWIRHASEWRSDRLFGSATGSGRISGSAAPRQDLGHLPPFPGLAGYRLIRGSIRSHLEGAGSWAVKIRKFSGAATVVDWFAGPSIVTTAKGSGLHDLVVPADSLLPLSIPALELNLIKGSIAPDSIFTLSMQWAAVRA